MTRAPLILDTDGGVDDAQALMMLLSAGVVPEAITTVFGNVALEAATRNILTVLAVCGAEVPVHAGQSGPLVSPRIEATEIHGTDGLGGAPRPEFIGQMAGADAVGFLVNRLRRAARDGAPVDVLAIGPLTNLAIVLHLAPDAIAGLGRVTIMGGTIHGRGNVTPAAEFNIFADPEAAAIVLRADLALTLVPWEVCTRHVLSGADVDAACAERAGPVAEFARALADHARATAVRYGGADALRFVDPLAAAVAIDPGIAFETEEASLDVVLSDGPARGMTLVDPSGRLGTPRATIVVQANQTRLDALFMDSLGQPR